MKHDLGKIEITPVFLQKTKNGRFYCLGNVVYQVKYVKNGQIIPFTLFELKGLGKTIDLISKRYPGFGLEDFERKM